MDFDLRPGHLLVGLFYSERGGEGANAGLPEYVSHELEMRFLTILLGRLTCLSGCLTNRSIRNLN